MKRRLNDELQTLVVVTKDGRAEWVEYDEEDTPKEEIIEMLKESEDIQKIYEGITNAGPQGLIWEREELTEDSVKDNESKYQKYKQMIAGGKKLSPREGYDLAEKLRGEGKKAIVVCKIPNEKYQKWYDKNKEELGTDIKDETTYITGVNEKAFDPSAGGYSIFAQSLGSIKRDDWPGTDRIEHQPFEWMMVFENEPVKDSKIKDYIAEDEGWKLDSQNAWDAWEEWVDEVGAEQAADDLAQALSYDELADALVFIFREHDFNSKYLEEEDEEEEVDEEENNEDEEEIEEELN